MAHSTTFKMAGLCVNHVPWHTRKSRDMCLCLQHSEKHTLFMAVYSSDKTNDEIQSSLWYSTTSELSKRVSWEFCVEQRDVLIRFRLGVCKGADLAGQRDEGASKSGSCLIQLGEERAGAPPYEQHFPPLGCPQHHPLHLTPLPFTSPHSSTLQGLGRFERPSWIEMRRGEEMSQSDLMMAEDLNTRGQLNYDDEKQVVHWYKNESMLK